MTVYDINNKIPVSESDNLLPLHGYGMSKVWAESLIKYYRLPSLIIRIPGVYGGKRTQGFIYNTIKALKNNEDIDINTEDLGYWETIHIDDLIYLFNSLMNQYSYKKDVEVFNISYGEVTDFIQTANFIKNEIASNSVIKINKCYQNYYLCNKKLLSYTTPEYSYYNRLKKYIQEVTK